jgi:hypothetical protein
MHAFIIYVSTFDTFFVHTPHFSMANHPGASVYVQHFDLEHCHRFFRDELNAHSVFSTFCNAQVQDVYAEVLCHLGGMHINGTLPNLEDLAETVWIDPNSDLREGRDPLSSSEGFGVFPHIRKVFLTADGTRKGHSFTPTPSRSIIAVNQELNEGARELVGAHVDQLLRPILEKLPNLMTSSRRLAHRMLSGMIFAATAPSVAPFAETIMCACVHSQQQERSVFSSRFGEGARGASALSDSICLTMQVCCTYLYEREDTCI